jgi:hypothetical protein
MNDIDGLLSSTLPKMVKVRQHFPASEVQNVGRALQRSHGGFRCFVLDSSSD